MSIIETENYFSSSNNELIHHLKVAKNTIESLKTEITNLSKLRNMSQELQLKNNNLEKRINKLQKDKLDITTEKNEEIIALQRKLNKLQLDFDIELVKFKKQEEIYKQKMEVVHGIEKDNWEYYEEVKNLKEENIKLKKKTEEELNSKDIENKIKYEKLKKKLIDIIKESQTNVTKLNIKYMSVSNRLIMLQNNQLLVQIENLLGKINSLEEENESMKKSLFELQNDIRIHQNVEVNLATNMMKLKEKISKNNMVSESNRIFNSSNNNLSDNVYSNSNINNDNSKANFNTETEKYIDLYGDIEKKSLSNIEDSSEKRIIKNHSNVISNSNSNINTLSKRSKSNLNPIKVYNNSKTSSNYNLNNYNNSEPSNSVPILSLKHNTESSTYLYNNTNVSNFLSKKLLKTEKDNFNAKVENDKLRIKIEELKNKLYLYQNRYNGLFSFLENSLELFFKEIQNDENKNFSLHINDIKKCDFTIFNCEEKYALLVLLMKYLMPLVTLNYNSKNDLEKNLFLTNINLIGKDANKPRNFLYDNILKKAFVDKNDKYKKGLLRTIASNRFSNSIPVLKKKNYI